MFSNVLGFGALELPERFRALAFLSLAAAQGKQGMKSDVLLIRKKGIVTPIYNTKDMMVWKTVLYLRPIGCDGFGVS